VESRYQAPEEVARDGLARVLAGAHGAAVSSLAAPPQVNYLAVRLKAGESWRYQRPAGHTVAWMALGKGALTRPERIDAGELVVFEPSGAAIDVLAEVETEFVLGSAVPHPHDLVLGYYSVHTSPASLAAGEARIEEIRVQLERQGRL
jgi:redox-sensitive bicupin YhaK (pirin superfamily)